MKIVVCVKQVPDTTQVDIDPETNTLVREGVDSVLNPLDTYAVEQALRIRDAIGGTVVALTMGPPQAEVMLRETLALGVDDAVLLTGREFAGSDTLATSLALAKAIDTIGNVDLILCGKQAIDGDTAQVGPEIAVHLGLPQITYVSDMPEITPDYAVVKRLTDSGYERVKVALPALMTVVKDLNEPRLPNLKDLIEGRFAGIRRMNGEAVHLTPAEIGLDGSPTRVVKIFSPSSGRDTMMFDDDIPAGIDAVTEKLATEGLL